MAQTLSPANMVANFINSELKDLIDNQKEYERIDTIFIKRFENQ